MLFSRDACFVDQESLGRASSNLGHGRIGVPPPFGLNLELPYKKYGRLSDRSAKCCFLCLEGRKDGQYAVQAPCFRPTKWRQVVGYRLSRKISTNGVTQLEKAPGGEVYEKLNPKENACESDAAIYQRLKESCFRYQDKWKEWIPFYGVVDVREVKVRLFIHFFAGYCSRRSTAPVHRSRGQRRPVPDTHSPNQHRPSPRRGRPNNCFRT